MPGRTEPKLFKPKLLMFTLWVCNVLQNLVDIAILKIKWLGITLRCNALRLIDGGSYYEKSTSTHAFNSSKQLCEQWNYHIIRHQKIKSLHQEDDSINALRRLAIDKSKLMECCGCGKSGHLTNNKICKVRNVVCNAYLKFLDSTFSYQESTS